MIEKWELTIPELSGEEIRHAYLYLPEAYFEDHKSRFPVLYMFDGHNVFFDSDATYGKSWGMEDYMDYTETQLLVAAVECNRHPDNSRLSEYSPFDFEMRDFSKPKSGKNNKFSVEGRGKQTMEWFANCFKPYIDNHYRTIPDRQHTFIAGSSMGGLMSLYAVLHFNHIFSRAAALSPSLWMDKEAAAEMIDSSEPAPDTVVYMDFGSKEWRNKKQLMRAFGSMSNRLLKKNILLTSRIVPGGTHCEAVWEKQIPFFMNTLLYDLK